MRLLSNRPFGIAIAVGVAILMWGCEWSATGKLIAMAICLFIGLVLSLAGLCRHRLGAPLATLLLLSVVCATLLFSSYLFYDRAQGHFDTPAEAVEVEGTVLERYYDNPDATAFVVRLSSFNGESVHFKAYLECAGMSSLQRGERFFATATVGNPDELDSAIWQSLESDGCAGYLSEAVCTYVSDSRSLRVAFLKWNSALSSKLSNRIGGREGGLAAAILLGNRDALSKDDRLAFRRAGIGHLLALSGLHVGILLAVAERFLRLLKLKKPWRMGMILLFAFGYLALTGFSYSTIRSVLMVAVLSLAFFYRETYDLVTSLFVSLYLILLWMPFACGSVSLWLSFSAVAGIALVSPLTKNLFSSDATAKIPQALRHFLRNLITVLLIGCFCATAVLPLSASVYRETSLCAVPATILLTPVLTAALILSAISLAIPLEPIAWLAGKVLSLLLKTASVLSDLPRVSVPLTALPTKILINLTLLSLLFVALWHLKRKWLVFLPLLLAVSVLVTGLAVLPSAEEPIQVTVLLGYERESFLLSQNGKTVLIDQSDGKASIGYEVRDAILNADATELSDWIVTHYHSVYPHLIAGLSQTVKVRKLHLPIPTNQAEENLYARMKQEAELHGIEVVTGYEDLAIRDLRFSVAKQTGSDGGEAETVFCAEQNGCRFCYVSASYLANDKSGTVIEFLSSADLLCIGTHGRSTVPSGYRLPNTLQKLYFTNQIQSTFFANPPPSESVSLLQNGETFSFLKPHR